MGLAGEVEGIEAEARDGVALVRIELDFETHPRPVVHAHVAAAGRHQLADLRLAQVDPFDIDDDAEVEPVDILVHDLEAHRRRDRIREDRL